MTMVNSGDDCPVKIQYQIISPSSSSFPVPCTVDDPSIIPYPPPPPLALPDIGKAPRLKAARTPPAPPCDKSPLVRTPSPFLNSQAIEAKRSCSQLGCVLAWPRGGWWAKQALRQLLRLACALEIQLRNAQHARLVWPLHVAHVLQRNLVSYRLNTGRAETV